MEATVTPAERRSPALEFPRVQVEPRFLTLASLSLGLGLWSLASIEAGPVTDAALLVRFGSMALVAAILPLQYLLLTRPLMKDVLLNSNAPRRFRYGAAAALAACSLMTFFAYVRGATGAW